MKEKIILKGVFYKVNYIPIILCCFGCFSIFVAIALDLVSNNTDYIFVFEGIALAILVIAWLIFCLINKYEIIVTDKRVCSKSDFGKRVDLPLDMISSVEMYGFKGIAVYTSSGSIHFSFCKNRSEVFNVISNLLILRQDNSNKILIKQESTLSNADELKKYKDLLDSGVITQEEFEAKKKQLLGL